MWFDLGREEKGRVPIPGRAKSLEIPRQNMEDIVAKRKVLRS